MFDLLQVYICPKDGEVLSDQVTQIEDIDTERDDVEIYLICNNCHREVKPKLEEHEGRLIPVYKQVDQERALWAAGFYDARNDDDDDLFHSETCTCETCIQDYPERGYLLDDGNE